MAVAPTLVLIVMGTMPVPVGVFAALLANDIDVAVLAVGLLTGDSERGRGGGSFMGCPVRFDADGCAPCGQ